MTGAVHAWDLPSPTERISSFIYLTWTIHHPTLNQTTVIKSHQTNHTTRFRQDCTTSLNPSTQAEPQPNHHHHNGKPFESASNRRPF